MIVKKQINSKKEIIEKCTWCNENVNKVNGHNTKKTFVEDKHTSRTTINLAVFKLL